MELTPKTKLSEILQAHPEIKGKLIRMDARAKMIDTPMGRLMLRKSTVADAASMTGMTTEKLIEQLRKLMDE